LKKIFLVFLKFLGKMELILGLPKLPPEGEKLATRSKENMRKSVARAASRDYC